MHRHSIGSAFDVSIRDDELEAHRIQLERDLQNTEISFRLGSASDDEHPPRRRRQHQQHSYNNKNNYQRHHQEDSSLEYPRHISEPSLPDFPSFAQRSGQHFGDEEHSHLRGWSYRTADDEEGISPYGGETMSTAAHHASALTLSAGLGGGRAARRDISLSGAEYDPERPLLEMIAGVNSKHSMFDRTKNTTIGITFDPLVVDSTAELDKILESGHTRPAVRPPSPISSASTSDSGHPLSPMSRPKLADHLRHVSFSPKRPRKNAPTVNPSISPLNRPRRQLAEADPNESMYTNANAPTPRATRQPEVRLQPATPSQTSSKFTRMARGINKEIEGAQQQLHRQSATAAAPARPASTPAERNPFHDPPDPPRNPAAGTRRPSAMKDPNASSNTTKGKVHLPDVTGLTAAVESPARPGTQYYKYAANGRPRETEARLLQTLTSVQGQLHELEEENSISRRRVRELELELEECKREVARERTRLFEREEMATHSHIRRGKGNVKGKAKDSEMDDAQLHQRYLDAVDEKKALESLITSLRTHLTRLTTELASHQELLTSLRQLREADAQELRAHSAEILELREQVQRLAGEVEVLRGVVEEGLKERRASRDISAVDIAEEDRSMSRDHDDEEEEEEEDADELEPTDDSGRALESDDEPEPFDPASLDAELDHERERAADRTMRTDFATLGESTATARSRERFVDDVELHDLSAELEARRADMSHESIRVRSRSRSPPGPARRNMRATIDDTVDIDIPPARARSHAEPSTARPSAPTPLHAARHAPAPAHAHTYTHARAANAELETPFPQIRGAHLERLFFSAPAHNAQTCAVCFRGRDANGAHAADTGTGRHSMAGWSKPRGAVGTGIHREEARGGEGSHSDEGYAGSDGERVGAGGVLEASAVELVLGRDGDMHQWRTAARKHGVPPQTVVARVVRELEDDFTHYKSIYVELADQYKVMDAASDVRRRNMLAKHLREVVDILEQKGDRIASLYDLLQFRDKPVSGSGVPEKGPTPAPSWGGVAARAH